MSNHELIDRQIMEGYHLLSQYKYTKACDVWLEAWDGLKELMAECAVSNVHDIYDKFNWSDFPSNYVQDLEAELHNAGLDDPVYYEKRIAYCRDLLKYIGDDEEMGQNTRRAIADSYYELGNNEECDRLYGQWLSEDPKWGWGYIGWFMCYESTYNNRQDIAKAAQIIECGLDEPDVCDRLDIVDKALVFYEENDGDTAKIASLRAEFSRLSAASPGHHTDHKAIPAMSGKVGRNDPCPCGSGKKYKKCHGASGGE
ncbi:MAG: SEC-C metal-binding domain-containing protein [Oscillospiraceae bacterium]|nr:SEC-C metal-binding domain-containing protein [Oscillospiraceae bacterium]